MEDVELSLSPLVCLLGLGLAIPLCRALSDCKGASEEGDLNKHCRAAAVGFVVKFDK